MFKSVHLVVPCNVRDRRSSTTSDWGRVLEDPPKVSFLAVEIHTAVEIYIVYLQNRILLPVMHAGAPPNFLLALPEFLNKVFPELGKGPGGPKQCLFLPRFKSLRVLLLWSSGVSCLCYGRRMTSATCNKEYRLYLWIFVRHAEFSNGPGSHCSHLQHFTSNTFFNSQEALNRKPCFRTSTFIGHSVLVLQCRFKLCWFGRAFFFHSL